jgi:hypothetical protein
MATLPAGHHLRQRLALDPRTGSTSTSCATSAPSYMLNELELEPWVIAKQLRHSDGGTLVVRLYGHPSREKAIERMRRAYGANVATPVQALRGGGGSFGGISGARAPPRQGQKGQRSLNGRCSAR